MNFIINEKDVFASDPLRGNYFLGFILLRWVIKK